MADLSNEKLTGILCAWTVHNVRDVMDRMGILKDLKNGLLPYIVTAEVVEDFSLRFSSGYTMHTTYLADFDLASMRIRTQNSIYELQGPGLFTQSVPKNLEDSVGNTILALSFFENMQLRWAAGQEFKDDVSSTGIRQTINLNQTQKICAERLLNPGNAKKAH